MRKGIMALEELNNEPEVAAEVTDFVEAPENDLADAAADEAQIDSTTADIDEAAATAETLEAVHGEMERSLEEGGMSEPEARALEVAVEHLMTRVGFSKTRKTFPAMESFGNKANRVEATKLAMENISERAKKLWETIVAALRKVWEHVKSFFKGLFNASVGLKKRAEALEKQAKATKGGHGPEGKMISTSSFKILTVDGKILEGTDVVADYKGHLEEPIFKANRVAIVDKLKTALSKITSDTTPEEAARIDEEAAEVIRKEANLPDTLNLAFGGAIFKAENGENGFKAAIVIPEKTEVQEKVEALPSSEVAKLASLVAARMDLYKDGEKTISNAIDKLGTLIKVMTTKTGEGAEVAKVAAMRIRQANTACVQATSILRGYDMRVATAVLNYAGASLKGLKQEEPKKEDKAAA